MNFDPSELVLSHLSVLAYANNFTLWHYKHMDNLEYVIKDGFFNDAEDMLNENDLILINGKDGNTSVWVTDKSNVERGIIVKENLLPVSAAGMGDSNATD